MSVILAGSIRCPAERMDDFRPLVAAMVASSRAEPGCIAYDKAESLTDPGVIHIFEHYRDEDALAAHRATPHVAAWRKLIVEFGVGERRMRQYDISDFRPI